MIIYRAKYKNIIFEFLPAEGESRGTIILCEGLPSAPNKKEAMVTLQGLGFDVVFPRYRGTWESGGEFLAQSPVQDIEDIVGYLASDELIKELYAGKEFGLSKNIYAIGSSFGGTVALCLFSNDKVKKIIALSPVVDFKAQGKNGEQGIMEMARFVKEGFNQAYRFEEEDWKKLANGGLFNPPQEMEEDGVKKVFVVFDENDDSVSAESIQDYCQRNGVEYMKTEGMGHLSFSAMNEKLWVNVLNKAAIL